MFKFLLYMSFLFYKINQTHLLFFFLKKKNLLFSYKFSYYLLVFSFFSIFKIRKNEMEEKDRKHNNKDQIYSFELIRTN
jgi:hypothetical protein